MLFFMGSSAHFGHGGLNGNTTPLAIALVIVVVVQLNAIFGKPGPIASVNGVIIGGFVMTAVLWAIVTFI
jgi:hypothetical protein